MKLVSFTSVKYSCLNYIGNLKTNGDFGIAFLYDYYSSYRRELLLSIIRYPVAWLTTSRFAMLKIYPLAIITQNSKNRSRTTFCHSIHFSHNTHLRSSFLPLSIHSYFSHTPLTCFHLFHIYQFHSLSTKIFSVSGQLTVGK